MRTMYWRSTLLAVLLVLIGITVMHAQRAGSVPVSAAYSAASSTLN